MLMSEDEVASWRSNPHHFIIQSSSMDYELTIRSKTLSIINELIEKYGDYAIQAILVVS
jgi:hypothetical protein